MKWVWTGGDESFVDAVSFVNLRRRRRRRREKGLSAASVDSFELNAHRACVGTRERLAWAVRIWVVRVLKPPVGSVGSVSPVSCRCCCGWKKEEDDEETDDTLVSRHCCRWREIEKSLRILAFRCRIEEERFLEKESWAIEREIEREMEEGWRYWWIANWEFNAASEDMYDYDKMWG